MVTVGSQLVVFGHIGARRKFRARAPSVTIGALRESRARAPSVTIGALRESRARAKRDDWREAGGQGVRQA